MKLPPFLGRTTTRISHPHTHHQQQPNKQISKQAIRMIKLYSMPSSGNSYKVRLLLAKLDIPFHHIAVEYNVSSRKDNTNDRSNNGPPTKDEEQHQKQQFTLTPEFRAMNPAGKVPLIEFNTTDRGQSPQYLSESNAILHYFAEGTRFLPKDKLERARAYQWMFFEQNVHEGSIAVRMATYVYPHRHMDRSPERMDALLQSGNSALDVMETQLQKTPFLAGGDSLSVADLCLYAYTHRAGLGGFDVSLRERPGIAAWLERVAQDPGHVSIEWLPNKA